jgi:menaquinone-9 beta-reductase
VARVTDAIVIGAGPAGAAAAWTLALDGARVTIVDPSHPREKPCGGGVTGRALALVAGLIDPAALRATVIDAARFSSGSHDSVCVPLDAQGLSPSSALVVASRREFDGQLLAAATAAGATLRTTRVTDVAVAADGVRVDTAEGPIRGAILIGADGANSLVRRRVGHAFTRRQISIATGFFAHGVTSTEVAIAIVADPPGYIWSFPRPDHLAIGICAQGDAGATVGDLRARTAEWVRFTRIAPGAALSAYAWPIPSLHAGDFDHLTLAGPRWCLAGDAAGLVDPITREGIYFAIQSGIFAAQAARSSNMEADYTARVRDEVAPDLRAAAQLKDGFFRPRFTRLLMRALRDSAAVRAVMADLVAGRQPYSQLKWRLIKTLELKLAAHWMFSARSSRRAP